MAELVFPSSPTLGDLFPDPAIAGVSQWRWDGGRWNLVAGGSRVTVSTTAPGNPGIGDLWFDAENGGLYVWFHDGTTGQWVCVGGGGGGGSKVEIGPSPPSNPPDGALWWDDVDGTLSIWTGSVWVTANCGGPEGPMGPQGPVGPEGQMGATGATGPTGVATFPVPFSFVIPGRPLDSQQYNVPIVVPMQIGGFAFNTTSKAFVGVAPTAATVFFTLNKVVEGVATKIADIMINSFGVVTFSSAASVALAPGDVLRLTAPQPQNITLSNVSFTFLAERT